MNHIIQRVHSMYTLWKILTKLVLFNKSQIISILEGISVNKRTKNERVG